VRNRHLLLPGLLLIAALALTACGSSDSGDDGQIEAAIEESATSTRLLTDKFLLQSTQESGQAAVKQCEEEATDSGDKADSVEVSEIEVDGEGATANAAVSGGSFDGQTLEVDLVKEGDRWKLNELTGFAELNRAKVVEAFEDGFEESSEVSKSLADCIVEGLEEASEPELEGMVLDGSSKEFEDLVRECS
jgi:hypothetical protein